VLEGAWSQCRRRHGGDTRILIIDDKARPAMPGAPRPWSAPAADALGLNGAARSLVRELTVPTPIPGTLPRLDLMQEGGASVSADPQLVRDLVARVEQLLAQARQENRASDAPWPGTTVVAGDLTLDLPLQAVSRGDRQIKVTQTEFRLLFALVRRRGMVASRQDLLREVWGGNPVITARVVDTHVARLRRKIEDDPKQPRHILTALSSGYRFRS
jgi:two-component system alkaline phosphatase synthesis response regulator PhoP